MSPAQRSRRNVKGIQQARLQRSQSQQDGTLRREPHVTAVFLGRSASVEKWGPY